MAITTAMITEAVNKPGDPLRFDEVLPKFKYNYLAWYPENEHIIQRFEEISVFLKINGKRDFYGANAVWEHIRWRTLLESSWDEYKLPAFACPLTSRAVMALNPELENMFFTVVTNPDHPLHHSNRVEIDE